MKITHSPIAAEVRFDVDEDVAPSVADAVSVLAKLPGVRCYAGTEWTQLTVPRNCWSTDAWAAIVGGGAAPEAPTLWTPAQPLYPHQVEAVKMLSRAGSGLLADTMGLGKTRAAIVTVETLAAAPTAFTGPRVVIAPGYTRDVWRRELLEVGACTEDEWTAAYSRSPLDDRFNWDAKWMFIHYDIAAWWAGFFATKCRRPIACILDEIHWIKNGRAKRSKAAGAIAGRALHRIGLTGTPIANKPAELYYPLTVLSGPRAWGTPSEFRRRYCGAEQDGYGLVDTIPTRVPELRERLDTMYLRRTIESAGVELPPLSRTTCAVSLDAKTAAKHDALLTEQGYEQLLDAILHGSVGKDALMRLTQLRKIVSRAKVDATVQLAADTLASGESVVIFTWQKKTADRIKDQIYKATGHGCAVHGGMSQDARDALVRSFQEGTAYYGDASQVPRALVATLGALREGVTLTKARHLILHDLDWVPSNILQAEARVYRIGQTKPTQVTWMMAKHSIDRIFADVFVRKAGTIATVLDITAAESAAMQLDLTRFSRAVGVDRFLASLDDELWRHDGRYD